MSLNRNASSEPPRLAANFVPVGVLDPRAQPPAQKIAAPPAKTSKRDLLRGLVKQAPFVAKNFRIDIVQVCFETAMCAHDCVAFVWRPKAAVEKMLHVLKFAARPIGG